MICSKEAVPIKSQTQEVCQAPTVLVVYLIAKRYQCEVVVGRNKKPLCHATLLSMQRNQVKRQPCIVSTHKESGRACLLWRGQ